MALAAGFFILLTADKGGTVTLLPTVAAGFFMLGVAQEDDLDTTDFFAAADAGLFIGGRPRLFSGIGFSPSAGKSAL